MAKIPLLECLTRHSYRESLEKSSSPRPRSDDGDGGQTGSTEVQRSQKFPVESADQDRARSSGLQEALLEEDEDEEDPDKTDAPSFNVTLLDWINVQDRPNDVEAVVRKCFDSINRVSAEVVPENG